MKIKTKLSLLIGGAVGIIIAVLTLYFVVTSNQRIESLALESAYNQAKMLAVTLKLGREYLAKTIAAQPPGTWQLNEYTINFIPAKFGRGVGTMMESEKGYRIKQTSLKLRNPLNAPDEFEISVLKKFGADRSLKELPEQSKLFEGLQEIEGRKVFRYAIPLEIKPGCLKCHSDSKDVPKFIKENYPQDQATGYTEGDLRGMISVVVPWQDIQEKILAHKRENTKVASLAIVLLIVVLLVIISVVGKSIVSPLNLFAQVADKVSKGDTTASIPDDLMNRKDEIGGLAGSFGRMIASLKVFLGGE